MPHIILDNGAGSVKVGFANQQDTPIIASNATAKVEKSVTQDLVGSEIDQFRSGSTLYFTRPFDRGYLNNWDCEIDVWTHVFQTLRGQSTSSIDKQAATIDCSADTLTVSEPPLNPESLQNEMNEVVFEYFGFSDYLRQPSLSFSAYEFCSDPVLNLHGYDSCLIVDSGFSFTHVAPIINSRCHRHAIRRLNVGGKLMTNYLKELVSYRQWNMMDEFVLMNQVKEDLSYVSRSYVNDLQQVRINRQSSIIDPFGKSLRRQFVLPDFHRILKGYVRGEEEEVESNDQLLQMETERFSVPELLFSPNDIGIDQAGAPEAAWQSLQTLSLVDMGLAASKVILTGGNANIPFFQERFATELRQHVPDIHAVEVHTPEEPDLYTWRGAERYVRDRLGEGSLAECAASRQEYLENGHSYVNEKFSEQW